MLAPPYKTLTANSRDTFERVYGPRKELRRFARPSNSNARNTCAVVDVIAETQQLNNNRSLEGINHDHLEHTNLQHRTWPKPIVWLVCCWPELPMGPLLRTGPHRMAGQCSQSPLSNAHKAPLVL